MLTGDRSSLKLLGRRPNAAENPDVDYASIPKENTVINATTLLNNVSFKIKHKAPSQEIEAIQTGLRGCEGITLQVVRSDVCEA